MKKTILLTAVAAASILATTARAATIELNPRSTDNHSAWHFDFDHSGQFGVWGDHLGGLQMLLDQSKIQDILRQLGMHVQDPLLQNVITDLENSNFQLTQQVKTDFQAWLQSHPFAGDLSQFGDWLHQHDGKGCGYAQAPGFVAPSQDGFVPEPSSIALLAFAGLGALGFRKLRQFCR